MRIPALFKYWSIAIVLQFVIAWHAKPQGNKCTFEITYLGFTQPAEDAFEYAAGIWSSALYSEVPVKINVYLIPYPGGPLGSCLPNGAKDFTNAPLASTWYPSALANALSGTDQKPDEADMDIFMNGAVSWYYGTDGNTPSNQYDFVSVALHEIGHGLGLGGTAKVDGSGNGSFGKISSDDIAPAVVSFPLPDMEGLPSVFDRYLVNGSGELLVNTTLFPNESSELAAQFTSGGIFFNGPLAMAINGNVMPGIYAPAVFDFGSSMTHLDEGTYVWPDTNALMTPNFDMGEHTHAPGPLALAMLEDFGWEADHTLTSLPGLFQNKKVNASLYIENYPNPFHSSTTIRYKTAQEGEVKIIVWNAQGMEVNTFVHAMQPQGEYVIEWDGKDSQGNPVTPGFYIAVVEAGLHRNQVVMIKP